jgi:mannose-6-phosphate isomerase-like protein (cupin superfamily)
MRSKDQKFVAHYAERAAFKPGLRSYLQYRDLGIKDGTGGRFLAHVIRPAGPSPDKGSGLHWHALDFQMNYVIRGWVKVLVDGQGELTFKAGDAWLQPPGIKHDLLGFSADAEWLEITSPADFPTYED